jgi:hypothetical protein
VIEDVAATWVALDHTAGVRGHLRNGLSIALDGSQDHLVSRTAAELWLRLGMSALRDAAVRDVELRFASGELAWTRASIDSLRDPFPDGDVGEFIEGQEVDGCFDDGEVPWDSEGDSDDEEDDDGPDDGGGAGAGVTASAVAVVPQAGDSLDQVEAARAYARRKGVLEALQASASSAGLQQVAWHVNREVARLEKHHNVGFACGQPSATLALYLQRKRQAEQAAILQAREEQAKKRKALGRVKAALRKKKAQKAAAVKERQKTELALASLPRAFKMKELGQGHKSGGTAAHHASRIALLRRIKLQSPPLGSTWELRFETLAEQYSELLAEQMKVRVGAKIIDEISRVIVELGDYYPADRPAGSGPKVGDPLAFEKFLRRCWGQVRKASGTLVV